MKKLRSLVAAVVAVACLYTPTATADPLSVELNALDSTIQVDGMAGDQPDGDAADGDQPNDNGVVESDGGALTSGSGEATVESEGADTVPEGADATPGEGDGAADDGPTADTPQAVDWTNAVDNLRLSTQGLTITPSVPADGETDADIAGTSVIPEGLNGSGVSRGAALGGLAESQPEQQAKEGAAQLPDAIDATLNLTFTLDAASGDGRTDGSGLGTIVAGDHFSVPMPEGLATADEGSALDVFARDTDGNTTTVRVAEAKASDGVLTVTFTEPADAQAREAVTASIDVPVTLDAALVQDEVSTIEWTVRTMEDAEGNRQPETLTIDVPAKADVLKTLGLVGTQDPESKENGEAADKTDEASDETKKSQTTPNAAEPLADNALQPETTYALRGNEYVQLEVTWCDNNYGSRPTVDSLTNGYNPQFRIGDGNKWTHLFDESGAISQDARASLHLGADETPSWATRTVRQTSVNTYIASASNLPDTLTTTTRVPVDANGDGMQDVDEYGKPVWQTKGKPVDQSIAWRMDDTNTYPERYQFGRSDDLFGDKAEDAKPHRYLMLTDTVTFTVDGRIGGENLSSIFQEEQARYFQFGASIDNKDQESDTLNTLIAQDGNPTTDKPLVLTDNGTTATITGTLPMYDENGDPIVYYIKYNGPSPDNTGEGAPEYKEGADYFQVSYNNAASDSHGSATDAVYSGGTMMLRRMGTTTYDATKVWLDNGDQENRPATSFTLWRYARRDGSSASTASQVQLNALDDSGTETNALEYVSIDVPAKSGGQVGEVSNAVDLGQLLEEKYGAEALGSLPKYDPDGYPYIYALREDGVPSGYEIVYGSVKAVNEIEDKAPNYEKPDYTGTSTEREDVEGTRPADDPLVYNGGTITNRITGQTEVSATKTWEISAFQDDLADVTTTFQLQSRVKDDADSTWTDVEGDNTTHTETGWKSETLTRTFSGTFPKYNALGKELEYRWVESGVSINGQDTGFERDGKGGGTFTLTLPTPEGETETLNFTSMFEAADTEDGIDTITNTFENTTEEYVEKWWQQPDGSMAQIKPDPNGYKEYPDLDTSGKVTFNVFQDGVQVGSFTMDGSSNKAQPLYKDGTEASGVADGFDKATWAETGSYDVTLANLPKYSPEGRRYSYLVLEESVSGWHTDRIYDAENHLTKVENTVGPGEGSEIRAMKKWVDGDDAAHRQPVVVQLVVTDENGIRSEATNDDGTPKYEYAYGETVTAVSQDNQSTENGQIILSADNSWFAEVEIPIGHLSYSQFKLVEVGLLQDDDTINPVVDSPDEAVDKYGDDTVWANVGWNYEDTQTTSRVANDEHVYETTAGKDDEPLRNDDMQAVVASNRRIGLFDLTVQKDWKDGGDASKRPDARLVLSCTEYQDAFSIDDNGNVWVQVSDNRLPVNAPTGPNDTDRRQLNAKIDNISLDEKTGSLVMQVDTSADDDGKYYFFGLPKYDASGNVVHYDVTEEWVGDHTGYVNSKSVGDYIVGTQHFHDEQLITFTNRRTGTRDVTFYKQWNDFYVNDELHQRPDIYLSLYRVTETRDADGSLSYSNPVAVDGYVHWLWQGTASDNPQYEQMATVHGLPAYDGDGNAYIYYASETMAADAASLDYDDVKFAYESIDEAKAEAEKNGKTYPAGENAVSVGAPESEDPTQNGTGYAIHEDGTFVNTLTSELVAKGTKLWEDVPGNVVQTQDRNDLPEITVYLQRRLPGEDWPSLKFDVDENGNWSIKSNGEGKNPGAVAWTSDLELVTANQYSYTIQFEGENVSEQTEGTPLDRYTEDGKMYKYRAIEVTWGLLGKDGGFTAADVEKTDFSKLRDGQDSPLPGVVVIDHGETGSFRLYNTYKSPTGSLTVKKLFSGREAGDRYPSTTFDVYRYYVNGQGVASEAEQVAGASHTLTNDELSQVTTDNNANPKVTQVGDNQANNTAEYTFSDLDIYAPDGSYWQYYVVERAINGYTTTVGVGDLSASEVTDTGMDRGEAIAGISSPDLCKEQAATESTSRKVTGTVLAEDKVAQDGTVTPGDTKPDVTFKNEYKPETANLQGTKSWIDYGNIFGVRPSFEEFRKSLKVERIGNGKTENITKILQSTNADGANYLAVTQAENPNDFTITLSKVEKWAPDGTAWRYRITETLSDMVIASTDADSISADDFYKADSASSMVSANSTSQFRLINRLYGQANLEKTWDDGDDPYGLRPTTVTVRLQARTTDGTTPGAWTDAYELLSTLVTEGETTLGNAGLNDTFFSKKLTANNGWKAAWQNLPAAAMQDGAVTHIEYRVVETAIGNIPIEQPTNADVAFKYAPTNGGKYHPYTPEQTEWTNNAGANSSVTKVKNTLDATSISATKTWANDTVNGTADAWGIRPTSNGTWSVTYLLQVRLKNAEPEDEWQWLMVYGAEQAAIDDPKNGNIVSKTITGSTGEATKVANWENLPKTDAEGKLYEYRVVERVPGGYDVTDDSAVSIVDGNNNPVSATIGGVKYRYYVVDSTNSAQSFTNTLRTVGLTGTKAWEDYGTGITPKFDEDNLPQMTLYRSVNGGNGQPVPYLYNNGQPKWTAGGENGTWTYTYENLPAADKNDNAYTYWAEETAGSVDGFYPTYDAADAAGTTVTDPDSDVALNSQKGTTITNVATKLTLTKVSDWPNDTTVLRNIELSILSEDGTTTYVVWTNGGDGNLPSVRVWLDGTTVTDADAQDYKEPTYTTDDGSIIGLPAGDYLVRETGAVPDGYALAADVAIHINADGSATQATGVSTTTQDGVKTIAVTVTDPVFRGQVELVKTVKGASSEALAGAQFELWRKGENGAADVKIAEDITTGTDGKWASNDEGKGVRFLTKEDGKRTYLSDGLLPGTYYFLEIDSTPGAWQPSGDEARFAFTIERDVADQPTHHQVVVKCNAVNEDFSATVILRKFDATDGAQHAGIDGAEFTLKWTLGDGTTGSRTVVTANDGKLALSGLEKGAYTLTETKNDGYDMTDPFTATFTIDNDNYDAENNQNLTYDITDCDGDKAKAIDFTVTRGAESYDDAHGIGNERLRGSVTIEKVSTENTATKIDGATFELQRKNGSDWEPVAENLVTGMNYSMNDKNTGLEGAGTAGTSGRITVRNLLWGTYRFVETAPAGGYLSVDADGDPVTSGDLVVGRTSLNPSLTGDKAVTNTPVSLELNKQNEVGEALDGAVFSVTPVYGSTFADGSTEAKSLTTENGGQATLAAQLVVDGTYEIYEEQAPAGYDPADAKFQVMVQKDGSLEVVGGDDALAGTGWARLDIDGTPGADNQFSFIATNRHLAIDLTKVSAEDPDVKLAGVKFRLAGPVMDDGDLTHDFITDENGVIHIECGLQGGTEYTLSELEAPAGYVRIAEDLRFRMNSRGEITPIKTVVEGDESHEVDITDPADIPTGWTVNNGDKISLTAEDKPVKLQITKRAPDTEDGKPGDLLEGAEFTVTPADGSTFANEVKGSRTEPRTITTGGEGTASMTAELVVGGTYDITETKAPKGYEKVNGTMRIAVDTDGTINVLGSVTADGTVNPQPPTGYTKVSGNAFEVQVENQPIEISLAKVDADDTATVLAGAEFEIQGVFADSPGYSEIRKFTTTADGTLIYQGATLDNLSTVFVGGNEYTLIEVTAPAGYALIADPWTFTVAENGEIESDDTVAAQGESGFVIGADKVTIMAMDKSVDASLVKTGADGPAPKAMAGAQFTLTGDFVSDAHDVVSDKTLTLTTGVDGTLDFADMKDVANPNDQHTYGLIADNGEYVLTETKAPQGYEVIGEPFTFTVGTDGRLSPVSAQAGEGAEGYRITGAGVTITATDTPVEIDLVKNGSDGKTNLNGAVFEVYTGETVTGTPVATATTTNGALSFDKLTANATYTLHEQTAPAGYELMPDVTFTVDEHGSVTFQDAEAAAAVGYAVSEANGVMTITATDQLIEVSLDKFALDGTTTLDGAVFELKPTDGNAFADGSTEAKLLTLEGSTLTFSGLVAGASYTLTETTAPEGYELAGSFTFTVDADGTISAADDQQQAGDDEEGYRIEAGDIAITAQDTPIGIELRKRAEGENGKALAGAVFKVTPADGDNAAGDPNAFRDEAKNAGITLDVDADGVFDTAALDAQLVAGNSYVIEEVTPPAGYVRIAGALTFTVDTDGAITAATGADNDPAFTIDTTDDVMTITAIDQPVEVTLNKVSSADPETKLDATFTLTGVFAADSMDGTAEAAESTRTIGVTAGTATLDRLIVGNTYVLRETKSQAGYEVIAGTLTFTVNADGTVTAVTADGNGAAIANDLAFGTVQNAERITATNTPVQISVAKVDEDGKPLEGAEFTLTGDMANADGTIEANHTWTVKPGADPAAVEGLIVTNGTDRHEYTLTEAEAPAGYESLGGITFTINPDGTIAGTGVGYTVDGSGVTITAQDTAIKARLRKTDENGQPQAGATFEIQATLGGTFSDGNTSKQFTTGADGFVDLDEHWFVGGNSYVITEVTAPGGYELAGAATFTVNKDGTITFHDDADRPTQAIVHGRGGSGTYQASSTADGVAVITASNSPIAVQLTKVSGTTPLAGATFELTPVPGSTFADGTVETQSITFTSAGVTALTNLRADATYTLKETVQPAGYELNLTEFTFTVAKDGTITPTEAAGYTVSGSEIVTITVNDEPIEVTLTKRNADGAALEGAEFTLHGMFANADGTSSGTVADRTVVVENGTVALEGLIADQQYTLTETKAPEGYRVNTGTLTFTVNTDGTLTEVESAEGYAIDADTATAITVTDQPTELDLTKLASDGTPLAGAEFTLAPDTERDADSRFVSDRSSIDLVVGEDGTVPTVTGELIAGHAYVLTETKAPDGYALITEPLHFTVGPKGRAASVTAGTELPDGYTIGGDKTAGTIALTAVDQPIELTLKKVNEDGDVLVGAEFTLSGRFADGTTQQILTTGADGTVALPLIIGGERYVLEETKAPEGYVLPAERYTFTVGVDGVIRVQQNPLAALLPGDKTFSLSQDGLTITVVNEREPVVAITGSDVTSVGFIGFGLLLIGATIAMQRRTRMAQVAGNGKPARGRHRR